MLPRSFAMSCLLIAAAGSPAFGQAGIYSWNSNGSDWANSANWTLVSGTGTGTPTGTRSAEFRTSTPIPGSVVFDPVINNAALAHSLTIAPNQNLGGWNFTGSGSLTVGGTDTTGLTTYGPGTYTFNGPVLAGTASNPNITVGVGSSLVLAGNTTAVTGFGNVILNGGTLRLDNTASVQNRLASTGNVSLQGSGTLELIGNSSAAVTQNLGILASPESVNMNGGVNTIRVAPNGQLTQLNFANSGENFILRPGTRGIYRFEATSGNLGDANGGRINFVGTPTTNSTNGLLVGATGVTSTTFGWAIASDAGGTNFATYDPTLGIIRATPTNTINNQAEFDAYVNSATDIVQMNIAAGVSFTANTGRDAGTLRITPGEQVPVWTWERIIISKLRPSCWMGPMTSPSPGQAILGQATRDIFMSIIPMPHSP